MTITHLVIVSLFKIISVLVIVSAKLKLIILVLVLVIKISPQYNTAYVEVFSVLQPTPKHSVTTHESRRVTQHTHSRTWASSP